MARQEDRKKAIELRLEGKSYSEIREKLGLSKSTLSDWLQKYPLNSEQIAKLKEKRHIWIEHYRQSCALRKQKKEYLIYEAKKAQWLPLSERELLLAGLFLYWGEGTKVTSTHVCVSNTDPKVIKFALHWFVISLRLPFEKVSVLLRLYSDMDIQQETDYWSNLLKISKDRFRKPYIKESTRKGLTYKSFGHGTCNLYITNVEVKREIIQSIKAISDFYLEADIITKQGP